MMINNGSTQSNLDCFLYSTTPIVESKLLPKGEIKNLNNLWHPWERETVEYFTLADLWSFYDELSAYGCGVPVHMSNGETLIQYYVPYLSAIQIYTSNPLLREENDSRDGETSDSYSDESENEKLSRWDGLSSDDGDIWPINERLGFLYFQYFERSAPHARVPLTDKIQGLARRYPSLISLRSLDLSPASWMAVAWYPIYHIPTSKTIKDLSTCFLTYHTLSSSFQDMDHEDELEVKETTKRKEGEGICLNPFALATYKMQGDMWSSGNEGHDQGKLVSLLGVADSWLKQLRVQHHDFNYFMGSKR